MRIITSPFNDPQAGRLVITLAHGDRAAANFDIPLYAIVSICGVRSAADHRFCALFNSEFRRPNDALGQLQCQ